MRLLIIALLLMPVPALADPPAARAARGSPEEIVCHREPVTGSLAHFTKTCMTRAGWQLQAEANQNAMQRIDELGRINTCTSPGGCEPQIGPGGGGGGPGA